MTTDNRPAPVAFAIEESDTGRGYKHIHIAGCRDLRDPEPITSVPTVAALFEAVQGYEVAEVPVDVVTMLAPCARAVVDRV